MEDRPCGPRPHLAPGLRPANRLTRRQAIPGFRDPPGWAARPRLWLADRSAGGPLSVPAVAHPPHPGRSPALRSPTGRKAMDNQPTSAVAARVSTPSGLVVGIPEGSRLVFGRGPDADLTVAAGRGLSRRAGLISAVAGGAWIANISQTHALYTEGD